MVAFLLNFGVSEKTVARCRDQKWTGVTFAAMTESDLEVNGLNTNPIIKHFHAQTKCIPKEKYEVLGHF